METILIIIVALVGLSLIALPVKMAAAAMDAKRTGTFWCLIALAGASILHGLGLTVPIFGTIIAFIYLQLSLQQFSEQGFSGELGLPSCTSFFQHCSPGSSSYYSVSA